MKTMVPLIIFLLFSTIESQAITKNEKIDVLLVTGQSNKYHSWQASSKAIAMHLQDAGLFKLDTAVASEGGESLTVFNPRWQDYDVVVLDYEGNEWPEATKTNFVRYIKSGGGLVVLHASDNSFPLWKEFNDMIGLGGWGGAELHDPALNKVKGVKPTNRNEKWGPRIHWQGGKIVRENTPGGAFHPVRHDFILTLRDMAHPITKGLPEMWLVTGDELYSGLRGPAKNIHILATGLADPRVAKQAQFNEPVLFTLNYGKGRVFHSTLGHVSPHENESAVALHNVGFITTLQRGTEWAATGKVTQQVPDDFPNVYQSSVRTGSGQDEVLSKISN